MATRLNPRRLVESFDLVLSQAAKAGRVLDGAAAAALVALAPSLDAETGAWCLDLVGSQKPDVLGTDRPDDPTLVVADLTDAQLDAAYRARLGARRIELPALLRHVPPPARWRGAVIDQMLARDLTPNAELSYMNAPLADHTTVDRPQSVDWYLRMLARRERPALKVVARCPDWVASLHTEAELAQIAHLIAAHL